MSTIVRPVRRYRRLLLSAPTAALAVTVLAGCGGGDNAAGSLTAVNDSPAATNTGAGAGQATGAPGAGSGTGTNRTFPGASGQIADIIGTTMQVQNTSTQTAVTYSDSTKITDTISATKADLSIGDCVVVRDTAQGAVSAAGGGTDAATGQPNPAAIVDPAAPVEATSVAISDAVDGACNAGGLGGLGGNRPQGSAQQGSAPQGSAQQGTAPQGTQPQGATNGNGAGTRPDSARGIFGGGANGKVVKVDGDTITVESTRPAAPAGSSTTSGSAATGEATTTTRTVTLTSGTTYTKTVAATASALKVGSCITALGTADDTGAIKATSIALSPAVNGACTSTALGRLGGGGNRGGANSGNAGTSNAVTGADNG